MSFQALIWLARWETLLFLIGLAATIGWGLLTGRINSRHLFYGTRADGSKYFSPERVQLLVVTIAIALQYLVNAAHAEPGKMPSLPDGALQVLGLSNGIYLGGKGWNMLRRIDPLRENNR
jgi:hypothetical protein